LDCSLEIISRRTAWTGRRRRMLQAEDTDGITLDLSVVPGNAVDS
jgi:hypothetical protein